MFSRSHPVTMLDKSGRRADGSSSEQICPLCGKASPHFIEAVSYEDVRYLYHRLFGMDVEEGISETIEYLCCTSCDLRFFSPQICGGPTFYETLQAFPWYYLAEKSEYHIASNLISAESAVLEIGCGAGEFSKFLPRGCNYRGLEYNDEAIRKARKRGLNVDRVSIEEFADVAESRFDFVCSFQVLEHVASPASFLKAAVRLLRKGGVLIVSVPSDDSFMSKEVNNVLNMPPHHVTRWTDTAMRSIGRIAGLQLVHLEHEPLSDMHLRPFAEAQIWHLLRNILRCRVPMVSRTASSLWVRALMRLASAPIMRRARKDDVNLVGHSVVAAYMKV